jgi:hypothetical protein
MGCGGSRKSWEKSVRGWGSKLSRKQNPIEKYNQKPRVYPDVFV